MTDSVARGAPKFFLPEFPAAMYTATVRAAGSVREAAAVVSERADVLRTSLGGPRGVIDGEGTASRMRASAEHGRKEDGQRMSGIGQEGRGRVGDDDGVLAPWLQTRGFSTEQRQRAVSGLRQPERAVVR